MSKMHGCRSVCGTVGMVTELSMLKLFLVNQLASNTPQLEPRVDLSTFFARVETLVSFMPIGEYSEAETHIFFVCLLFPADFGHAVK